MCLGKRPVAYFPGDWGVLGEREADGPGGRGTGPVWTALWAKGEPAGALGLRVTSELCTGTRVSGEHRTEGARGGRTALPLSLLLLAHSQRLSGRPQPH